jgi:hypothetical protein
MNKKTSKLIVAIIVIVIFLDFALAEFSTGWNNSKQLIPHSAKYE